jgi:hypothetical protein
MLQVPKRCLVLAARHHLPDEAREALARAVFDESLRKLRRRLWGVRLIIGAMVEQNNSAREESVWDENAGWVSPRGLEPDEEERWTEVMAAMKLQVCVATQHAHRRPHPPATNPHPHPHLTLTPYTWFHRWTRHPYHRHA